MEKIEDSQNSLHRSNFVELPIYPVQFYEEPACVTPRKHFDTRVCGTPLNRNVAIIELYIKNESKSRVTLAPSCEAKEDFRIYSFPASLNPGEKGKIVALGQLKDPNQREIFYNVLLNAKEIPE